MGEVGSSDGPSSSTASWRYLGPVTHTTLDGDAVGRSYRPYRNCDRRYYLAPEVREPKFEVLSSKFRKPRTSDLELSPILLVTLFAQVSRISRNNERQFLIRYTHSVGSWVGRSATNPASASRIARLIRSISAVSDKGTIQASAGSSSIR